MNEIDRSFLRLIGVALFTDLIIFGVIMVKLLEQHLWKEVVYMFQNGDGDNRPQPDQGDGGQDQGDNQG